MNEPCIYKQLLEQAREAPKATDQQCREAWDTMDNLLPGECMTIINKFAALGWNTLRLTNHVMRFMPKEMIEMVECNAVFVLAIEHAVRQHK